jgi:hypothetical protein
MAYKTKTKTKRKYGRAAAPRKPPTNQLILRRLEEIAEKVDSLYDSVDALLTHRKDKPETEPETDAQPPEVVTTAAA